MPIPKIIPVEWQDAMIKADNGDKNARDYLECLKQQGFTEKDIRHMKKRIYASEAKKGNVDAMFYMAKACLYEPEESYYWFYKCAQSGDTEAMWRIGINYTKYINETYPEYGYGYDLQKAEHWLIKAYQAGDYEGLRLYAYYCCEKGSEKQKELFKQAAKKNWKAIIDYIDWFYNSSLALDGHLDSWLIEEYLKALKYMKGNPEAQDNLDYIRCTLYTVGYILGKDYCKLPIITRAIPDNTKDISSAVMYLSMANYLGYSCMDTINAIVQSTNIPFNKTIYQTYCREADRMFMTN